MDEWLAQYDIEIELTLLPTEVSGKRGPIFSGYRGGHIYLDHISWIASFDLKGRSQLFSGETAPVLVTFFFKPEALVGRLWVGREFMLLEGARTVGSGTITAMLNFDAHVQESLRWEEEEDQRRKAERDKSVRSGE